jgi:ribosome-binding factor A
MTATLLLFWALLLSSQHTTIVVDGFCCCWRGPLTAVSARTTADGRLSSHRRTTTPTGGRQISSEAQFHNDARRHIRSRKVSRVVTDELNDILERGDVKGVTAQDLPFLRIVSIANVEVNADCSLAKVLFSVLGNAFEKRKMQIWFTEHQAQLQHSLRKRLRDWRSVPTVSFKLVDQTAWYLQNTLDDLERERIMTSVLPSPVDEDIVSDFDCDEVDWDEFDFELTDVPS